MKKLLTICLIPLIISCTKASWQYDNDKWVSFKEKIELAWNYGEDKIDYFEIDRVVVKIRDDDINEIKKLVKEKNDKKLIEKENEYRQNITFDKVVIRHPVSEKRVYIDKEKPLPSFGEICFYQIFAVVDPDPKRPKVNKSPPAELSVILLPKF